MPFVSWSQMNGWAARTSVAAEARHASTNRHTTSLRARRARWSSRADRAASWFARIADQIARRVLSHRGYLLGHSDLFDSCGGLRGPPEHLAHSFFRLRKRIDAEGLAQVRAESIVLGERGSAVAEPDMALDHGDARRLVELVEHPGPTEVVRRA